MISSPISLNPNPLDYRVWFKSYHKLQQKPKTVLEFKNALQMTRFALSEKAIDSAVRYHQKWLQACVSAYGGNFDHLSVMW